MKSIRLLFALACVSLFASGFIRAADEKPAADQPKEKPACACCCCKAKTEGKTCDEHKQCCCPKDKCAEGQGCAKQDQPKPAETKAP